MARYAFLAVALLRVDLELDDEEEFENAYYIYRDLDFHDFALLRWPSAGIFRVSQHKKRRGVEEMLIPVPDHVEPGLLAMTQDLLAPHPAPKEQIPTFGFDGPVLAPIEIAEEETPSKQHTSHDDPAWAQSQMFSHREQNEE